MSKIFNLLMAFSKLIFAYATLVSFFSGLAIPLQQNHEKFIHRPEIILFGAFFFLKNSFDVQTAIIVVIYYYLSTIISATDPEIIEHLFGPLSKHVNNLFEFFSLTEAKIEDKKDKIIDHIKDPENNVFDDYY